MDKYNNSHEPIDELLGSPKKLFDKIYELENSIKLAKQRNKTMQEKNQELYREQDAIKDMNKQLFTTTFSKIYQQDEERVKKANRKHKVQGKARFEVSPQPDIADVHHLYQSMFMPELKKQLESTRKMHKIIETKNKEAKRNISEARSDNEKIKQTIVRYK